MSDNLAKECEDAEHQLNDLIHDLAGEIPEINIESPTFVAIKSCLDRIGMASTALEEDRDRLLKERDHWKANHDRMAGVKRAVLDRPDLAERASLVQRLIKARDAWRVTATDLYRICYQMKGMTKHGEMCRTPVIKSEDCFCGLFQALMDLVSVSVTRSTAFEESAGVVFPVEVPRNDRLMSVVKARVERAEKYCPLFGEHRSIPCSCGYPTEAQQVEINATKTDG